MTRFTHIHYLDCVAGVKREGEIWVRENILLVVVLILEYKSLLVFITRLRRKLRQISSS